jgi:hypothetical protein|nr:MAG TPA: hypothetical protein [Caudoviricetes sp.]
MLFMGKQLIATGQVTVIAQKDSYTFNQSISEYVFTAQSNGIVVTAVSFSSSIKVMLGDLNVTDFTIGAITKPSGFSAITVNNTNKSITYSVTAGTTTLADSGLIAIPVIIAGVTYQISFAWSKARAGANGTPGVDANLLDWVREWNSNKTTINGSNVITPKIFTGFRDAVNGTITGTAIGHFSLSTLNASGQVSTETIDGIYGFKNGLKTFSLDNTGNAQLGNGNQFIRYNAATGRIEFGSDVTLNWTNAINTAKTETLNSAATIAQNKAEAAQNAAISTAAMDATNKINAVKLGVRNYIRNSDFNEAITGITTEGTTVSIDNTNLYNNYKTLKVIQDTACTDANAASQRTYFTAINNKICSPACFSMYVKGSVAGNIKIRIGGTGIQTKAITTGWQKITIENIIPTSAVVLFGFQTVGTYWCALPMLVEGTKAVDWSPAPEDINNSITEAKTAGTNAKAIADAITNRANSEGWSSKLTYVSSTGIFTGTLSSNIINAIQLNASQITTGIINAARVDVTSLKASLITAGNIEALTLNVIRGKIGGWSIDTDSIYRGVKNNTSGAYTAASGAVCIGSNGIRGFKWRLDSTGAGAVAGGNISWDASGNVSFGSSVVLNWQTPITSIITALGGSLYPKMTQISGTGIYTGTLTAAQINAVNIDAGSIKAGTLSADRIAAGSLNANKITTRTITADRIVSGSITASEINVSSVQASVVTAVAINGLTCTFVRGMIGGWTINASQIYKGNVYLGSDGTISNGTKWLFRNDGSGQLANGAITWNAAGAVTFSSEVSLNWANAATNALNSAKSYADTKKNEAISSASTDATNKANAAKELASAMAFGRMLYRDPTFWNGSNSINVYNNSGNGTVTATRTADSNAPNDSKYVLLIKNSGPASPYCGGFSFGTGTSYRKIFITRIIAKIPSGRSISYHSNAIGNGGIQKWLTSVAGTGDWCEYVCKVICGTANFSSTHYFAIDGNPGSASTPVEWRVAYATVFDVTSAEKYTTTIDANGVYTSSLNANQITAGTIRADRIATGSLHGNKITARTITASNIATGTITATEINTASIQANIVTAGAINALTCTFSRGSIGGWTINSSQIYKNNVYLNSDGSIINSTKWKFNNDGSGQIANGNISWNTAGTVTFGASVSLQWKNDIEASKSTNYGYRYYTRIVINGESGKYYPVVIKGGDQTLKRDILVRRTYSEQAPSDWANSNTHMGGLNLLIKANFGGWGGAGYSWNIYELEEVYCRMFAGATLCGNSCMFAIYLRGGGSTGAVYHIYSGQPLTERPFSESPVSTQAPQICYNSDLIFKTPNGSGGYYTANAPAPRTITSVVETEIKAHRYAASTYIDTNGIYTGTLNANQIIARSITADRIAAGTITANEINVGSIQASVVTAGAVNGLTCTFNKGKIGGFTISDTAIYSVNATTGHNIGIQNNGYIYNCNSSNTTIDYWALNTDGSAIFGTGKIKFGANGDGWLANKNISWDTNGNVSMTGTISATAGKIGNFNISGGKLVNSTTTASIEFTGLSGSSLYLNSGSSLISIRSDVNKTGISIQTYSTGARGIYIVANAGSTYSIEAYGPMQLGQRGGERWCVPGVLYVGCKYSAGYNNYYRKVWGDGMTVSSFSHIGDGKYRVYHNLGHTDYTVTAILWSSTVYYGYFRLLERTTSYFVIQNIGSSGKPDQAPFDFVVMGRNKW